MLVCIIISGDASSNISTININPFYMSTSNISTSHISSSNISTSWSLQFLDPKMSAQCSVSEVLSCSHFAPVWGPLNSRWPWAGGHLEFNHPQTGNAVGNNVQVFVMLMGNPTLFKPTIYDAHASPTHALNQQTLPNITQVRIVF